MMTVQAQTMSKRTAKSTLRKLVAGCAVAMILSGPVFAQSDSEMANKISRLENEVQTLSQAVFRGNVSPSQGRMAGNANNVAAGGDEAARFELRVAQLETEIRSLTGQIEQNNFRMRQMEQLLEKRFADIEMRLADAEARTGMAGSRVTPYQDTVGQASVAEATGAVPSAPVPSAPVQADAGLNRVEVTQSALEQQPMAPQDQANMLPANATANQYYDVGFAALRAKDYEKAATYFDKVVTEFPGHALAGNAQYWLGETFYVRNDYERAARIFAEAYQKYSDGSKGPDNLLKLGMSLAGLGKKKDACVAFSQLKKQYKSAPSSILSRADQEMNILSCS